MASSVMIMQWWAGKNLE